METTTSNESQNRPTHLVKVRHGQGKKATYERIGAAWENQANGFIYVKLHGTQIIEDGFSLYPVTGDLTE